MREQPNIMQSATIQSDGTSLTGEEVIRLFKVETDQKTFWFELDYEVAENGLDFWIVVSNFGLARRSAAGSKTPLVRWKFTALEAQTAAQARLREFFFGSAEKEHSCSISCATQFQVKGKVPGHKISAGVDNDRTTRRLLGAASQTSWANGERHVRWNHVHHPLRFCWGSHERVISTSATPWTRAAKLKRAPLK